MTIYHGIYSLVINLSMISALIFGLNDYPSSILLVLFFCVMSLQIQEFKDFSLHQEKPYQNQSFALCSKVLFFILPSASFLLISYLIGCLVHNFI